MLRWCATDSTARVFAVLALSVSALASSTRSASAQTTVSLSHPSEVVYATIRGGSHANSNQSTLLATRASTDPEYNRRLAQRRAETVKQFLVELGVAETSIKVITVGPEGALCDDPGKGCQQLNRRVHLEIRRLGPVASAALTPATDDVQKP